MAVTKIRIVDIVDSSVAVSTEKAQRVYKLLARKLRAREAVELSFEGVDAVITAFLNTAIGQLYKEFSDKEIRTYLHIEASPEIRAMIKSTADNAKRFFKNPAPYREAYRQLAKA